MQHSSASGWTGSPEGEAKYRQITEGLSEETRQAFNAYANAEYAEAFSLISGLLAGLDLDSDRSETSEVRFFYLSFVRLFMDFELREAWDCNAVNALHELLLQPAKSELGNHERSLCLLQLLANAGDDCGINFDEERYFQITRSGDLLERNHEYWLAISRWVFLQGYADILEEALGEVTVLPGPYMQREIWQRINLMHQITRGKVTRLDVLEYLKLINMVPQLEEFREDLVPRLELAGLWDKELEGLLSDAVAKLGVKEFRRERSTRKIRS
ncbi:MAG: hypothetical protein H7A35_11615 [Planctomycetales bacterium]|nr:hypothetical protein [bacterium]UNM07506.1 MAG: hypothetical protein H7A35_11615 [Planctomycetales bacterium]